MSRVGNMAPLRRLRCGAILPIRDSRPLSSTIRRSDLRNRSLRAMPPRSQNWAAWPFYAAVCPSCNLTREPSIWMTTFKFGVITHTASNHARSQIPIFWCRLVLSRAQPTTKDVRGNCGCKRRAPAQYAVDDLARFFESKFQVEVPTLVMHRGADQSPVPPIPA